jgi:3-oxoacyl-[acyl-carrier protein] reductase
MFQPHALWAPGLFTGQRVLITGGLGGIGRELVAQCQALGMRVVVTDLPASIAKHGLSGVTCFAMNGKSAASVQNAVTQAAQALGGLDACVNLVGYMSADQTLVRTEVEVWDDVMRGNLDSAFYISKAVLPHLHESPQPSMVHVSSGLGAWARPMVGAYGPAKAGLLLLIKELALENAPKVRINAVAPGAVDTAFLRGGTGRSDEQGQPRVDPATYGRVVPLGRIAQPSDVVQPILFLLSPASAYMTGQTLHINGGTYMP